MPNSVQVTGREVVRILDSLDDLQKQLTVVREKLAALEVTSQGHQGQGERVSELEDRVARLEGGKAKLIGASAGGGAGVAIVADFLWRFIGG